MTALAMAGHAWRFGDLLAGLVEPEWLGGRLGDCQVTGLTRDSRALTPGALFLACQGRSLHGLAFADEARRRGATAILAEISETWSRADILDLSARLGLTVIPFACLSEQLGSLADRFHGSPSARVEVLGVSGRFGRGSVTHLLAQALGAERACAMLGALGQGFPEELQPWPETRLDALILQRTLSHLECHGARTLALEIPPHRAGLQRVAAVRLTHLVLTAFAEEGGEDSPEAMDALDRARELLAAPGLERIVLNLDDPLSRSLLRQVPATASAAAYSLRPDAPMPDGCDLLLRARAIDLQPSGLRLRIERLGGGPSEQAELRVGLIGRFNAANLLAVLAVVCARGASLERAVRAFSRVRSVPGRMEPFGGEGAPLVVVDSARTPDALQRALGSLRHHARGQLIGVLGCAGRRDHASRPLMGAIAERLCDRLILTDDNPRGESGDAIIAQMLAGLTRPDRVRVERRRGLAIRRAIALAGRGDAVLVAGKGHETIQDMGDLKMRFSDRAQVFEVLREWREGHH